MSARSLYTKISKTKIEKLKKDPNCWLYLIYFWDNSFHFDSVAYYEKPKRASLEKEGET